MKAKRGSPNWYANILVEKFGYLYAKLPNPKHPKLVGVREIRTNLGEVIYSGNDYDDFLFAVRAETKLLYKRIKQQPTQ